MANTNCILALDGMNSFHRARSGFTMGPAPVIFNFARQLRALVEKFNPSKVYIGLEGHPIARHAAHADYKANRVILPDDPKAEEMKVFFGQVNIMVDLLYKHFPVSVVRHAEHECDDTLANLVMRSSADIPWIIASSDSDFIQLLHDHKNLKLYNPIQKEFVQAPHDYDYTVWKALRGDATDNIPGIPGIGDKTAAVLAEDPCKLAEFLHDQTNAEIFTRNYELIKFVNWTDEELAMMTSSSPTRDWDAVKTVFTDYGFKSIVKPKTWEKFVSTFDPLFNDSHI